jgi:PhnB protein
MASLLTPYLSFRDTARAALEFYRQVFGGELTISTFGEFGMADGDAAGHVMHGQLETPSGYTLMAADTPPGMEAAEGSAITVCLSGDDVEDLRRFFAGLAEGGTITHPLEKQMWGDEYGSCTDKFGIPWMANISEAAV